MSWLSQNYEKAALGGAAVIALGLAFLGYTKFSAVEQDYSFIPKGSGNNKPEVKDAEKVTHAAESLKAPRTLEQAESGDRPVDLFTSVPLFISRNSPGKPVDPIRDAPIHPPIPNSWWLQYRLDPGFADSPQRDADGDGFSNVEEFEAKTDPTDKTKYPSLIAKLKFVREEALVWILRPGFEVEGGFTFNYDDSAKAVNKVGGANVVKPNETFFAEEPMKGRFKLLGSETRNVKNERTQTETATLFVRVEDQRPNKKGKIYDLPSQFPEAQRPNYRNFDRTAVLKLDALGQGSTEFKIEENTAFALPANAPKKDYLLKSVSDTAIEVEYTDADGSKKTVQIPKG